MEQKPKRRFGDRAEGRRLRTVSPYIEMMSFVMPQRNDALNMFRDSLEMTEADHYMRSKRQEGMKGLGVLHLFIASYLRAVAEYPAINRFIAGRRIYARNDVVIVMSIKREMTAESEETSIKVHFSPSDTIYDVYNKMTDAITRARSDGDTSTDAVAKTLMKLPRFVLNWFMHIITAVDYLFGLPKGLLNASPFHGSMIVTDLGSLGIPPVFHHIYNFGNLPVFVSFGCKRKRYELDAEGNVRRSNYLDFTVTSDERICDGYNFAAAFKIMHRYMTHPELLETPPETVKRDVE